MITTYLASNDVTDFFKILNALVIQKNTTTVNCEEICNNILEFIKIFDNYSHLIISFFVLCE